MSAIFPSIDAEKAVTTGDLVWQTPDYLMTAPFQLWTLAEAPPFGALALDLAAISCAGFEALAMQGGSDLAAGTPIALYGIGNEVARGDDAITLFTSTLIDGTDPYELSYDHSTTLGSAGAPVFDLATGKVIAVHIGSRPGEQRRTGFGMALPLILDEIRMDLETGEEAEPLEPVCGWPEE